MSYSVPARGSDLEVGRGCLRFVITEFTEMTRPPDSAQFNQWDVL